MMMMMMMASSSFDREFIVSLNTGTTDLDLSFYLFSRDNLARVRCFDICLSYTTLMNYLINSTPLIILSEHPFFSFVLFLVTLLL